MKVRRVVTGHDQDGRARFVDDTLVEPVTLGLLPGYEFHLLWGPGREPHLSRRRRAPAHRLVLPAP